MKKLGLALMMLLLLGGCSRPAVTETVADALPQAHYTVTFAVPEDASPSDDGSACTGPNGDYCIVAGAVDAASLEDAVAQVSGFPAGTLDVIALQRGGMGEYRFAWSSAGEEGETVSCCALCVRDGGYYAVTMTQRAGLGTQYAPVAEAVFASIALEPDGIV